MLQASARSKAAVSLPKVRGLPGVVRCSDSKSVAATSTKVLFPKELEAVENPPLNTYKTKEPYIGTVLSVERIVGPNATGETCHIVIDHGGNVPYWEGQSYGIIPPVRLGVDGLYCCTCVSKLVRR